MDDVQKVGNCIHIPLSRNFSCYLYSRYCCSCTDFVGLRNLIVTEDRASFRLC
jgi:hypothetical protein